MIMMEQGANCSDQNIEYFSNNKMMLHGAVNNLDKVLDSVEAHIDNQANGEKTVNISTYMEHLTDIMTNLADLASIDDEDVEEFTSLKVEAPLSDRQNEKLMSIRATLDSTIAQLHTEVVMAKSAIQDIKLQKNELIQDSTNLLEMASKNNESIFHLKLIDSLIEETIQDCEIDNPKTAAEYHEFVMNEFYPELVNNSGIEYGVFLPRFEGFAAEGIQCLSGNNGVELTMVRVVIGAYLDMYHLDWAIATEAILEEEGSCPVGSEPGDWDDGSGSCCCDQAHQPESGGGLEPVPITLPSGEEPVEFGTGETPVEFVSGQSPVPMEGTHGSTHGMGHASRSSPVSMGTSSTIRPTTKSRVRRDGHMSTSPMSTRSTVTQGSEEPVSIGGEEPVTVGGEDPVSIGGEEPVSIGGEEPVPFGGEEPVPIDG